MPVVTAPDGVPLQVDERGEGPPVVLVHGTTGSAADWVLVSRELRTDHRVLAYDRRGRGRSGDGRAYSFAAELDDLRAVLDHVGEPAHLVGHSFGARLALDVAADRDDLRSLTLYEPPLDLSALSPEVLARVRRATAASDWEGVLAAFHPVADMPASELALFRSAPGVWEAFLEGARTLEREVLALVARPVDLDAAGRVRAPAQLLRGELTTAPVYAGPREELVARLRATVHVLPGQRHTAMVGAPAELADAVRRLTYSSSSGVDHS